MATTSQDVRQVEIVSEADEMKVADGVLLQDVEKAEIPTADLKDAKEGEERGGGLGWPLAGLILFSFTAPSTLVGVPYALAKMGILFGLFACTLVTFASIFGAFFLLEIYIKNPTCENLPDLGRAAMGKLGYNITAVTQMMNFLGFLPVALVLNGLSLQGMVGAGPDACTDIYIIAIAGFCFCTTQVRALANAQLLTIISLIVVFGAFCIIIGIVSTVENPAPQKLLLIGYPGTSDAEHWFENLLALTTAAWAFVPSFLTVELASAMPRPQDFRKSIVLAACLILSLFFILGVTAVTKWGSEITDPIDMAPWWPHDNPASRIMHACFLIANVVSYALDSVPLARYCQKVWMPDFKDDWSAKSIGTYALISLPTFLFGLIASISVGNLLVLLAFVTALSVPWVTQIFPAIFYYRFRMTPQTDKDGQLIQTEPLSTKEKCLIFGVGFIGLCMFVVCMLGAIGKVALPELRGPTVIGCGSWTLVDTRPK